MTDCDKCYLLLLHSVKQMSAIVPAKNKSEGVITHGGGGPCIIKDKHGMRAVLCANVVELCQKWGLCRVVC